MTAPKAADADHDDGEGHAARARMAQLARAGVRASARATGLAALTAALAAAALGPSWSLGVALGAAVGWGSVTSTAIAVKALLGAPQDPAEGRRRALWVSPLLLLKWPLVLLALAAILWYMPARAEAVAFGVVLALAASAMAWRRVALSAPPP